MRGNAVGSRAAAQNVPAPTRWNGVATPGAWHRTGLLVGLLALAACSRTEPPPQRHVRQHGPDPKYGVAASPRVASEGQAVPKGGGTYKLGNPYKVAGRWYVPREDHGYDRTGLASWYGTDFHGRKTANGEVFDMNALTAAHPTLPLPSYVYVTNLENGRTLLLRVNDRGPYAHDRILDLSRQSARLLGTEARGVAQVRVRYAGRAPLDGSDARERQHLAAQPWNAGARYASTASSPAAAHRPQAVATSGAWTPTAYRAGATGGGLAPPRQDVARHYVQVGIFRDPANVARLRQELSSLGNVEVVPVASGGGSAYRVRLGPLALAAAEQAARQVAARGVAGARIVYE